MGRHKTCPYNLIGPIWAGTRPEIEESPKQGEIEETAPTGLVREGAATSIRRRLRLRGKVREV